MRATVLLVALLALLWAGCGDKDDNSLSRIQANDTDLAFATEMLDHHERALDAADLARTRAHDPVVRRQARDLLTFWSVEAQTLRSVRKVLMAGGVDEGDLGVPTSTLDPVALRKARDFDAAYAAAMIPHHELAIRMAAAESRAGKHAELRRMAGDITDLSRYQIRRLERTRSEG